MCVRVCAHKWEGWTPSDQVTAAGSSWPLAALWLRVVPWDTRLASRWLFGTGWAALAFWWLPLAWHLWETLL